MAHFHHAAACPNPIQKLESNIPRHNPLMPRHDKPFQNRRFHDMPQHAQTMPRHDMKNLKNKNPNPIPSLHFKNYSPNYKTLTFPQSPTISTLLINHQNLPKFLQILSQKHLILQPTSQFYVF